MLELNKIYNENCITFMDKLQDSSVSLIIADPPYNIAKKKPLKGTSHGAVETLSEEWDIFESKEHYMEFTRDWLTKSKRILTDTGSVIVWGNYMSIFEMKKVLDELGFYYRDLITWVKRDAPPNVTRRGYASSTEFALWYCKSEKGWIFNHDKIKKYNNGKQMRNFWDIQRSMTKAEWTPHKTQKKIELSNILIDGHSNEDETVYIPFAGSGTEIISCLNLNRKWLATETKKEYIEEIINPRILKNEVI